MRTPGAVTETAVREPDEDWGFRRGPRTHIPALDGLRGTAILGVLLVHAFASLDDWGTAGHIAYRLSVAGAFGVDLFFVLSGFLITGILVDSKTSPTYFRSFYARRALRLFPLYYGYLAVVFAVVPAVHRLLGTTMPDYRGPKWWYWSYLANWKPDHGAPDPYLGHFWSLAVEEQFYLFWSLAIYLVPHRLVFWFCAATGVLAIVLRSHFALSGLDWEATYRLTPLRLDSLAIGGMAAMLHRSKNWRSGNYGAMAAVFGLCFAAVCTMAGGFEWSRLPVQTAGATLFALAAGCLTLAAANADSGPLLLVLQHGFLRSFGKYSYGIYVLHLLVFDHLGWVLAAVRHRHAELELLARIGFVPLAIGTAWGTAWVSWRVLEERFLVFKRFFPY